MLSRVDEMAVIRGVNVYPSAIEGIVRQFPEIEEFVVEQRNVDGMEEIELLVEIPGNVAKNPIKRLENKLRDTLHLRIPVRVVAPGAFPKGEFKSKRWRKV